MALPALLQLASISKLHHINRNRPTDRPTDRPSCNDDDDDDDC